MDANPTPVSAMISMAMLKPFDSLPLRRKGVRDSSYTVSPAKKGTAVRASNITGLKSISAIIHISG